MTAFTTAIYDTKGILLKASQADPIWTNPTVQQIADMIARAADAGCTYHAGTVLVWADDFEPEEWIEDLPEPDASCAFGPGAPAVPTYRWEHADDWTVTLSPAS